MKFFGPAVLSEGKVVLSTNNDKTFKYLRTKFLLLPFLNIVIKLSHPYTDSTIGLHGYSKKPLIIIIVIYHVIDGKTKNLKSFNHKFLWCVLALSSLQHPLLGITLVWNTSKQVTLKAFQDSELGRVLENVQLCPDGH